jgi:hypothetical protein
MVFDADEFLSIKYGDGTLDDLLDAAKAREANGIVVTWRVFGSGGAIDWSRAPVTEQYLMAAPEMWNKGWGVKTLFTFSPEHWKLGIHRPKMKNKWIDTEFPDQIRWLNGSGRPMEEYFKFRGWRSIVRTLGYDWVQLNHYAVKSVESYALRKLRGNVNFKKDKYNSDYWSLMDRNEVREDTMLRYTARRDQVITALLKDPVLNGLHLAAVERAEARLAEIRATDAYRSLVADLAAASAIPIDQITAKPPQARDPAKIAALMSDVEKRRTTRAREDRLAQPKPPPPARPPGTYVPAPRAPAADAAVEWVRNHSVELPAEAGLFAPQALAAIRAGKFERGLARRMPFVLPKGALVLEIGAAAGFLAAHLAEVRNDLTIILTEDHPGLRAALEGIRVRNSRPLGVRAQLLDPLPGGASAETVLDLLARRRPQVLILADPALEPAAMLRVVEGMSTPLPVQIFLTGRALERRHEELAPVADALIARGYQAGFSLDPALALGFGLGPDDDGGGTRER